MDQLHRTHRSRRAGQGRGGWALTGCKMTWKSRAATCRQHYHPDHQSRPPTRWEIDEDGVWKITHLCAGAHLVGRALHGSVCIYCLMQESNAKCPPDMKCILLGRNNAARRPQSLLVTPTPTRHCDELREVPCLATSRAITKGISLSLHCRVLLHRRTTRASGPSYR